MCPDFDLCPGCESKGAHAQHDLTRIRIPRVRVYPRHCGGGRGGFFKLLEHVQSQLFAGAGVDQPFPDPEAADETASQPAAAAADPDKYAAEIATLRDMGFDTDQAAVLLARYGGNVPRVVASLL